MRRYTRYAMAILMAAAIAYLGWGGMAHALKSTTRTRLVQMQTDQPATRQPQTTMQTSGPRLPEGVTPKDLNAAREVRDTFSSLTKNALKKDNFKDFADNFVDTDRERLERGGNENMDVWNKAVDDFDQAWKSKYNASFEVGDKDKTYSDRFLAITTGQVTDPKQITHWPLSPTTKEYPAYQQATASPNIKKDTEIAVVTVQGTGTGNEQPIQSSLLRDGRKWKIDIPDTVSADDLKASVANHLNALTSTKDQWPGDPNDAARVVTYHLLQACYTAGALGNEMGAGSTTGSSASEGSTSGKTSTEGNTSEGDNNDEHNGEGEGEDAH